MLTSTVRVALGGELETVGIDVGDDDVPGAGKFADRGSHAADRAGSGDEDVFRDEIPGEGGVDGIAKGVEGCSEVFGNAGVEFVDVAVGDRNVVGKGPGTIDADSEGLGAKVVASSETVSAAATDEVTFGGNVVAHGELGDPGSDLLDVSTELVTNGHGDRDGALGPSIPVVDVDGGAANSRLFDPDEDVLGSDLGDGDLFHPEARFGLRFDECSHVIFRKPTGRETRLKNAGKIGRVPTQGDRI